MWKEWQANREQYILIYILSTFELFQIYSFFFKKKNLCPEVVSRLDCVFKLSLIPTLPCKSYVLN